MDFETKNKAIGLDISDSTLRFVVLKKHGKKNILDSFGDISVPKGVMLKGEIKDPQKFITAAKKIFKQVKPSKSKLEHLVVVLPEAQTFIKVIEFDVADESEIEKTLEQEMGKHIPLDINEIYFAWQILKIKSSAYQVVVGAAPKKIVDNLLSLLEKSGFEPHVFEIEAASILRSLVPKPFKNAKIIIDFGADRSSLILVDQNTTQFTVSLNQSGKKITETISQKLRLDEKQAEKAKIVCGLDPTKCDGALLKILIDSIDQLSLKVKNAIKFYGENHPNGGLVDEIILCGGGANFSQIDKVLSEKTGLKVTIGDPTVLIAQKGKKRIPQQKILSYTTAIGLGLRSLRKKMVGPRINILPPVKKKELRLRKIYVIVKNLIVVMLLYTIVIAIALLIAKFALQNHFNTVVQQTTLTTRYGNLFNKDIKIFNRRVKDVEKAQSEYIKWSEFIYELNQTIPEGISLTVIDIDSVTGKLILRGQSRDRTELLAFKDALEASKIFSDINVPLETLLQPRDITFSIDARAIINLE